MTTDTRSLPFPDQTMVNTLDENKLIQRIIAGEPEATRLVLKWITTHLRFRGWRNRIEYDMIAIETWLTLVRKLREGAYGGGGLEAYTHGICEKKGLTAWRNASRYPQTEIGAVELASSVPGPDEFVETAERRAIGGRILLSLPIKCRRLLLWRFFENLSCREIAQRLNTQPVAARGRLHRCLKKAHEIYRRGKKE